MVVEATAAAEVMAVAVAISKIIDKSISIKHRKIGVNINKFLNELRKD